MADRKISDLTALTAPAAGDYLPIVDISEVAAASKNKRITIEELFRGVPDGTAAAPSIAPENDPNTGIYSSGADQLSIATNGTERLRIDSAGQIEAVSLGTAAAPTFSFTGDPNTGIYSPGADQLALSTNGTGRLFIDANGDITSNTSPSTGLGVRLYGTATGTNVDATTSRGVSLFLHQTSNTNNNASAILFANALTNTGAYIAGQYTSHTNRQTALVFGTGDNAAPMERLRITSAGLVGIGTSSPQSRLQVLDQIRVSNSTQAQGSLVLGDGASTAFNVGIARWNGTTNAAGAGGIGYFSQGAGNVGGHYFYTGDAAAGSQTARMIVNPSGLVGIGTTAPSQLLHCQGNALFTGSGGWTTGQEANVYLGDVYGSVNYDYNTTTLKLKSYTSIAFLTSGTTPSEKARITPTGQLLVGTSASRNVGSTVGRIVQIEGTSATTTGLTITRNSADTTGTVITLGKSRSASNGGSTVLLANDSVGALQFAGADGTDLETVAASISCDVDGTPGSNDMPGRIVLSTTSDGASSPTERMRIDNAGGVFINRTTGAIITSAERLTVVGAGTFQRASGTPLHVNRTTDDGNLLEFYQDTAIEGSISVSGNTVSLNGAHLSRWSQLPGNGDRVEILRGTVLSNLDEMCDWGEQTNEQLNRMKVSDVEGDFNVAGVFQGWDNDDEVHTKDFYCAMTGDMIIRIAEGVTVQRGDLLMSAGDGTAKPQDDDIIRSKTVAKVTSTNVSCTYDDGSYCVPCVLMAC